MSAPQQGHTASAHDAWPLYRALVGIGMLCAAAIVTVFLFTQPLIERHHRAVLERAVLQVLPGATWQRALPLTGDLHRSGSNTAPADAPVVYAGLNPAGELIGVAVPAEGMGYQDVIRLLYGYAPEQQRIVGLTVLTSRETPGLGDRIADDVTFLSNFRALDVRLNDDGNALQHAIEAVKRGDKRHGWQIDGITGATVSSQAVASILQRSSQRWLPRIYRQRDAFSSAPGAHHEQP